MWITEITDLYLVIGEGEIKEFSTLQFFVLFFQTTSYQNAKPSTMG